MHHVFMGNEKKNHNRAGISDVLLSQCLKGVPFFLTSSLWHNLSQQNKTDNTAAGKKKPLTSTALRRQKIIN